MNAALDIRRLARELTLDMRREAHKHFDQLWRHGSRVRPWMTRHVAYAWLANWLGVPREQAHIANLTLAQCRDLVAEVERLIASRDDERRRKRGRRENGRRSQHRFVAERRRQERWLRWTEDNT